MDRILYPALPARAAIRDRHTVWSTVRILIVNCNTTAEMTERIVLAARPFAAADVELVGAEPAWGVSSAEGYYDSFISAAAVLDVLAGWTEPVDAVVLAGFGEHGREGARQLLDVPVVDITEAAAYLGALVGHRFGVVTTMAGAVAGIHDSLRSAGIDSRCSGVRAAGIPVVETGEDADALAALLENDSRLLIEDGADTILLGCAGFAGLDVRLEQRLGVPVIDGTAAAVLLAETLVRLGKKTSKVGAYARPIEKPRPGWPRGPESAHRAD